MDGDAYIEKYYYEYESLPPLFYEKVVSLENKIIAEMKVNDFVNLGRLYKSGVEHFSMRDNEITQYFFAKLQELLMNGLDLNKLDERVYSKKKTSVNFLKNIGKIKIKKINFKEIIKKHSYGLDTSKKLIDDELDLQKLMLYEKMKSRRTGEKMRRQSMRPMVNDIIENFIKKFHLTFVAKVYPKPLELTLETVIENYDQQIKTTLYYDDKVTDLEMLKIIDEGIEYLIQITIIMNHYPF
jgi:hypothetical protein